MGDSARKAGTSPRQWRQLDAFLIALGHSANRLDGLENVKELIVQNQTVPTGELLAKLVRTSCSCASDPNSRIANRWLQFLAELVSQHTAELTPEIPKCLPVCVASLGAISGSVRRAAVQLLSVCAKTPECDPLLVLQSVAEGIKDRDESMRAECCSALVTVYSGARYKSAAEENKALQELVIPALVPPLSDASPKVVAAAATALDAVRWRAPDLFESTVKNLPLPDQQQVRQRLGATPKATPKATPSSSQVLRASIGGHSKLIGVEVGDTAPAFVTDDNADVAFGFVPNRLLSELQDANNWRVRALAVEELQALVADLTTSEQVREHVPGLIQLLVTLLGDVNFKIEITALQTLGEFIALLGEECRAYAEVLVQQLVEKLGDNKTLVRHANAKVMMCLMRTLGPEAVLPNLIQDGGGHENWRVREEVLVLSMLAVLTFKESQLPLEALVTLFHQCLDDQKPKIKFTAIEALALLHSKLGRRVFQLLPSLDQRQKRMLEIRFAQPQLPTVNADGHLELPPLPRPVDETTAATPGGEGSDVVGPSPSRRTKTISPDGREVQPGTQGSPRVFQSRRASATIDGGRRGSQLSAGSNVSGESEGKADEPLPSPLRPHGEMGRGGSSKASPVQSARSHSSLANSNAATVQAADHSLGALMTDDQPLYRELPATNGAMGATPRSASTTAEAEPTSPNHKNSAIKPFWMDGLSDKGANGVPDQAESEAKPVVKRLARQPASGRRAQAVADKVVDDKKKGRRDVAEVVSVRESAAWGDLQNAKFESLPGGVSSPPQSPPLRTGPMSPEERKLQHSKSQPLPASDDMGGPDGNGGTYRITPRASLQGGVQGLEDVKVNKDDISSRLSILKTRGRTGQGRRMTNTAPEKAQDEGLGGTSPMGAMRPGEHEEEKEEDKHDKPRRRPMKTAPSSLVEEPPKKEKMPAAWAGAGPVHAPAGDNEPRHIPIEDLEPLDDAEVVMRGLIKNLTSPEWGVQMEALNNMRALSIYHASETILPRLHDVVRASLLVVDNLRSQLSKAAIMSITDMIRYLKHQMDPELDGLVTMMVKKATETSGFIAEEAKKALTAMIECCTETRTCTALLHANANKNANIRAKVAVFVAALVEHIGPRLPGCRDLDKFFPVVVHFLSEGSVEPRQAGKKAVLVLHHNLPVRDFARLLQRCPEADQRVVDKLLAQEEALGSTLALNMTATLSGTRTMTAATRGTRPQLLNSTQRTNTAGGPSLAATATTYDKLDTPVGSAKLKKTLTGSSRLNNRAGSIREEESDSTVQRINDLAAAAAGSDFRLKQDAFESLAELMLSDPKACGSRAPQLVDAFVGGFKDNNQKVALSSLQSFSKLVSSYGLALEGNCGVLVPAVGGALAHSSMPIRTQATSVLDSLCATLDPVAIAAPLAQTVDFGNQRSKAALVERMRSVVGPLHDRKPQVVMKTVVPLAVRLLDEHKADIKAATTDLVKELYAHLDRDLFSGALRLSDKAAARFREITGAPPMSPRRAASPRGR